jgi:hypothetical protein
VAKSEAERRRERLAEALRENLKRRKAHKRGDVSVRARNGSEAPTETSGSDALSRPKPPR